MVSIEFVDLVSSHQGGPDRALLHESREASPDTDLGPSRHIRRDLANGQRSTSRSEDS